jgi:hypothetical protein
MPLIIISICCLVGLISAAGASLLQPQESDEIRLERKIAISSKRWCPPNDVQRTNSEHPRSAVAGS